MPFFLLALLLQKLFFYDGYLPFFINKYFICMGEFWFGGGIKIFRKILSSGKCGKLVILNTNITQYLTDHSI